MSAALEPQYHGILARFQKETNFRGSSKRCLVAFSRWLIGIADTEAGLLPLAISAALVTRRFLDEEDLSKVVVRGAEAFEIQYGMGHLDFVRVHLDLLATFIDACRELNRVIPSPILAIAREQLQLLEFRSEWRD